MPNAPVDTPEAVTIARLEWMSISQTEERADSIFGEYRVFNTSGPGYPLHFDVWVDNGAGGYMVAGNFKSLLDGKSAAQANHDGLVRSVILARRPPDETEPVPDPGDEVVAWVEKDVRARPTPTTVSELPDDIRVPLHELHADMGYLFGRVAADGSMAGVMTAAVRKKLELLEATLRAALNPGTAEGWRDIETAPKDGTQVIGWVPSYYQGNGGYGLLLWLDRGNGGEWMDMKAYAVKPSLWQPLPARPSEQGEG
jgi:hypothetical protein